MQCYIDLPLPTLHTKTTCASLLIQSPRTTLHRKIISNVVLIYADQHCTKNLPLQCWPMFNKQLFMLCLPSWENIAQENCILNVLQIHLRQHCTRKLLVQYRPRARSNDFEGKQPTQFCLGLLGSRLHKTVTCTMQKQPPEVFCKERCS